MIDFDPKDLRSPELYRLLVQRFGKVTAHRIGEEYSYRIIPDLKGGIKEETLQSGEYYRVNCPFCGDRKRRLLINHKYGSLCKETKRPRFHLAKCLNETNCLSDPDKRRVLVERIFGHMNSRQIAKISRENPSASGTGKVFLKEVPWPGNVVKLSELPPTHPAISWLVSKRGYDLKQIERSFDVRFCLDSRKYPACKNRIIIPIKLRGAMVGWQARVIDVGLRSLSAKVAKYYTMPGLPKSQVLYNWDSARHTPYMVVTEGVTDVWRIGPSGVAVLGSHLSSAQERLIADWWHAHKGKGFLVFMWDGDLWERDEHRLKKMEEDWKRRISNVVSIRLDPAKDPDNYGTNVLWEMIKSAVKEEKLLVGGDGNNANYR